MKKLLSISFAVLLGLSTIGITVDKHYCHGHYIGTWFYVQEDACDMDMPMESDWCHDDITIYSVENEFQSAPDTSSPKISLIDIITFVNKPIINIIDDNSTKKIAWVKVNPPPSEPNIYTKVQSFLL